MASSRIYLLKAAKAASFALLAFLPAGNLPGQTANSTGAPLNYSWPAKYQNPLTLNTTNQGPAVSCPDPAIIKERSHNSYTWYLYCTGDPLNSSDVDANGNLRAHLITQYRSYDLIRWTYIGDAFAHTPAWIGTATGQF